MDLRGVHCVVWYDCEAKRELDVERIAETLTIHERRAEFKGASAGPFEIRVARMQGETTRQATVDDLKKDMADLAERRCLCETCEANVLHRGFGCYSYIPYPITEDAEEWLWRRLPERPSDPVLDMFWERVKKRKITGEHAHAKRRQGLIERSKPYERGEHGLRHWRNLSTDLLFDYLLWSRQLADWDIPALFLALRFVTPEQVGMTSSIPQIHAQFTKDNIPFELPDTPSPALAGLAQSLRVMFQGYRLLRPTVTYG